MTGFTIAQVTRKLNVAEVMQRASVTIDNVVFLKLSSTVNLVNHVLEGDRLVRSGTPRPHILVSCIGPVASVAIASGIVPVAAMQA